MTSKNKKIAILQSNYIPWKGYFDIINSVDEFIIYDSVNFTKNDWRNRNIIKTRDGTAWISIPARVTSLQQSIAETKVAQNNWAKKHFNTISQTYAKAKHYKEYSELIEDLYIKAGKLEYISDINYLFITAINNILGIKTIISKDTEYNLINGKTEKLVDLVKQANGTTYLSGPAAKNYLEENLFADANISVEWIDYSNYPMYPQNHGDFKHGVTILDLIFNTGSNAPKYMKSFV